MKYTIIVSDRAAQMIEAHVAFLKKKDQTAAQKLRQNFIKEIRSLETTPARYSFFNEQYLPANKYHKMIVGKYHLVIYQIQDNIVYVDWVIDGRQDYQWLFRPFH